MWLWALSLVFAAPDPSTSDDAGRLAYAMQLEDQLLIDFDAGRFPEAAALAREVYAIRMEVSGPLDNDTLTAQNNLAALLSLAGDPEGALALIETHVTSVEQVAPGSEPHLHGLVNLSWMRFERDEYEESIAVSRRCLALSEGDPALDEFTATCLNNLATAQLEAQGPYAALPNMERALALRREVFGDDHPEVATTLNNLGNLLKLRGDYDRAIALYTEALARWTAAKGPDHPDVATVHNNLSAVYRDAGRYGEAQEHARKALLIWRTTLGPDHPDLFFAYTTLSRLAQAQGDLESAAQHLAAARRLAERPGASRDRLRVTLLTEAFLAHARGDAEAASRAADRVLELLDAESPVFDRVLTRNNLASLFTQDQDFDRAAALLAECRQDMIEADAEDSSLGHLVRMNQAAVMAYQGHPEAAVNQLTQVVRQAQQRFGAGYPLTIKAVRLLAASSELAGAPEAARPLRSWVLERSAEKLPLLTELPERQALRFSAQVQDSLDHFLTVFDQPGDEREAYAEVLRFKGVASRTLAARARDARRTDEDPLRSELTDVRAELGRLLFSDDEVLADSQQLTRIATLEQRRAALEEQVGEQDRTSATPESLCTRLQPGEVLVDYVSYYRVPDRTFAAFVLDHTCAVRRVELGKARPLTKLVQQWRHELSNPYASTASLRRRGAQLAERIWQPLGIEEADAVWIVPDAELALVPWAALPLGEGYLVEQVEPRLLVDAVGLERPALAPASGMLLVGDVDFGEPRGTDPCGRERFGALPGTGREIEEVAQLWRRWGEGTATRLTGENAHQPEVIEALEKVGIAHLATHGFLDLASCTATRMQLRTGIALSDANHVDDPHGMLTSEELATLDLSHVRLVVLSACETALGELSDGEGVRGFQSAFQLAGAQAAVMSLWSVPDESTSRLMASFYRALLVKGEPPAAALRSAQLAELRRSRRGREEERPQDWAAWIVSGK